MFHAHAMYSWFSRIPYGVYFTFNLMKSDVERRAFLYVIFGCKNNHQKGKKRRQDEGLTCVGRNLKNKRKREEDMAIKHKSRYIQSSLALPQVFGI